MTFESLLDNLYGFDAEIFAHDSLFVFINYKTKEEKIFHNCPGNDIQEWIDETKPILMGFNCNNYDKHILRCWIAGMTPEELKQQVNDYIISGGNGWDINVGHIDLPIMWDLFNEINPRKSLKEIEANLRLPITETTVPFDLPTKWTEQQRDEVIYYCRHDVLALFPLFDKLKNDYKSKFIICKFGHIDPAFGLSQTNANLTAILLKAEKHEYDDNFKYLYPDIIDKSKIPKEALNYFDDIIEHNDLDYSPEAPIIDFGDIEFQIGTGGGHAFKKQGIYTYERSKSKKILCNWDFASLYPNIVRIFGYSSRSQGSKSAYVDLLKTRIDAKHKKLSDEFLKELDLTNDDVNIGLKLPLNAYTGGLRAKFNALYDNLQGFSICTTGQLIVLQLIHDLKEIPTLEMVSANTDAVMFEVSPEYKEQADKVIHELEDLTGLEMEEDNIVRIVMRDVNNYCELVQIGEDDYKINYKGGEFKFDSIKKNFKLKWDKETKTWTTKFEDAIKVNSLTICGEALLKYLMLDIPIEETINNCNDIFRFQYINHAGNTYEKVILEKEDGTQIELQKNNRIYAGFEKTGTIYKVKPDGRKDSVAMCPVNPMIDNDNQLSIEKINKMWYIKYTKQKLSDFKKEGRVFMEEKLDKLKKDELINLIKEMKEEAEKNVVATCSIDSEDITNNLLPNITSRLYAKINEFRRAIRSTNFILDTELPNNLGGGEYASIDQYYQAVQNACIDVGLDFSFEAIELDRFDLKAFTPATGAPQNVASVKCRFTLTDIDTGCCKDYIIIAQGSDSIDKAASGAETLAFRIWLNKNFSPCMFNGEMQTFGENGEGGKRISLDTAESEKQPESSKTKTPVYVPKEKKEEIVQNIVSTPQKTENNEDIENLVSIIYEYREKSGQPTAGAQKIDAITKKEYTDLDILNWTMTFKNALDKLGE